MELVSTHRLFHEGADFFRFGVGQLLERERSRPHLAIVEVRRLAKAQCRVSRFEFVHALEKADDFAASGVGGHSIPGFGRKFGRDGFDNLVEPSGDNAIRFGHLGDFRQHIGLARRFVFVRSFLRFQFSGALFHGGSFLGGKAVGL